MLGKPESVGQEPRQIRPRYSQTAMLPALRIMARPTWSPKPLQIPLQHISTNWKDGPEIGTKGFCLLWYHSGCCLNQQRFQLPGYNAQKDLQKQKKRLNQLGIDPSSARRGLPASKVKSNAELWRSRRARVLNLEDRGAPVTPIHWDGTTHTPSSVTPRGCLLSQTFSISPPRRCRRSAP